MPSGIHSSVNAIKTTLTNQAVRANNVANVNTKGYKSKRTLSADTAGSGPVVKAVNEDFSQGSLKHTGLNADVALEGAGFFQLESGSGAPVFKRHLNLHLDSQTGRLLDDTGNRVPGTQTVGESIESLRIKQDGTILAVENDGKVKEIGRLLVVGFQNPHGLQQGGEGVYNSTSESGHPQSKSDGYKVLQGFEESSNVSLAEQITGQMVDEKVVIANIKTIQTQDAMLGDLLDLKG